MEPEDELVSQTIWKNETNEPVRFGFTSEDEMNVLVGYYW